jgi:hypothetical protein
MLSRGAFWKVIRALQSDINILMLSLPAFSSPLINEDLSGWAASGV